MRSCRRRAQADGDVGPVVRRCQILVAIAVEVANGYGARSVLGRERRARGLAREAAVAGAEAHGDVVRANVRRRQVLVAVSVKVADGEGARIVSRGKWRTRGLGRKGAVSGAKPDSDVVGVGVYGRQILIAVVVKVTHGDSQGKASCGEWRTGRLGRKGPVAGAKADGDVAATVCRRQVVIAVVVYVADGNKGRGVPRRERRARRFSSERPVACPESDADVAGVKVRRRQVLVAVVVEVTDGDGLGSG